MGTERITQTISDLQRQAAEAGAMAAGDDTRSAHRALMCVIESASAAADMLATLRPPRAPPTRHGTSPPRGVMREP